MIKVDGLTKDYGDFRAVNDISFEVRSGEVLGFLRRSVDELDQTVVMVTHDPRAASFAHRVLFLADGLLVGELTDPTQASVLDALRALGAHEAGH